MRGIILIANKQMTKVMELHGKPLYISLKLNLEHTLKTKK